MSDSNIFPLELDVFLTELCDCGILENYSIVSEGVNKAYMGIDINSDSFHLGHLVSMSVLKIINSIYKIEVIIVLGDYTMTVGDNSMREKGRTEKSITYKYSNMHMMHKRIRDFFGEGVMIVRNSLWLNKLSMKDAISMLHRQSLNRIMKNKMISRRLKSRDHIPLSELLYSSLQGYDYYYLNKILDCNIQVGGVDQTINIMEGVRSIGDKAGYIMTGIFPRERKISKTDCNNIYTLKITRHQPQLFVDKVDHLLRSSKELEKLFSLCSNMDGYESIND